MQNVTLGLIFQNPVTIYSDQKFMQYLQETIQHILVGPDEHLHEKSLNPQGKSFLRQSMSF